jgi:hypothetical protein
MTYVSEFKVVETNPEGLAFAQIKERIYYEKYQDRYETTLLGIKFSKRERNVVLFESERVSSEFLIFYIFSFSVA